MDDIDFVKRVRKCGKLKYWPHAVMWTSTRRMRQWGYAKFFVYQITNVIDYHLKKKAHTGYDNIR
jgi:GT2 family glycosyltransferase